MTVGWWEMSAGARRREGVEVDRNGVALQANCCGPIATGTCCLLQC